MQCDKAVTPQEKPEEWKKEINSANFRRELFIQWVAEVVREWRGREDNRKELIRRAFVKTGCAVTVDGSGWDDIKPERVTAKVILDV